MRLGPATAGSAIALMRVGESGYRRVGSRRWPTRSTAKGRRGIPGHDHHVADGPS